MSPKKRKRRSEAQVRHSALLHKSQNDPLTYYATSLEEVASTAEKQRERARLAEVDAEHNRKALARARNQTHKVTTLREKLTSKELTADTLSRSLNSKEAELRERLPVEEEMRSS
ncbi:hypothetical protein BJ322DRAFT_1020358 [Thelephora terrestris]|uniref:Uncharacterized protein n=1 Tax=Thelephora terrestris TaxID=56493 RepID=A0A9P6HFQ5_9AGAM|nr:hypothetical protein BJ322DRAFT_1020358 [Thelephora terrestris]